MHGFSRNIICIYIHVFVYYIKAVMLKLSARSVNIVDYEFLYMHVFLCY